MPATPRYRRVVFPLSEQEEAGFAAIIAQLGNTERRRIGRITAGLSASALVLVGVVMLFFHWPWGLYIAFSSSFAVAMGVGWAWISRHPLTNPTNQPGR